MAIRTTKTILVYCQTVGVNAKPAAEQARNAKMNISELRKKIEERGIVDGVKSIRPEVKSEEQAIAFVQLLCQQLLDNQRYGAAAEILWGPVIFDPRPSSVKRIWTAINKYHKLILLGAGAMGKSYCSIIWCLLDWVRDPEGTSIKVISTSEGHAKSNVFSTLTELYRSAIIPLPGLQIDKFIGLDTKELDKGIALISIPQGDTGKGRLRGFHPRPRATPHPTLGPHTRVRVFADEGEECPIGIWDGVDNLLTNMDERGSVKVIFATNPKDPLSQLAEHAEPVQGWTSIDLDTDQEWESKDGYRVVRIDAARSENVINRRLIFPGLMSYQGFENLRLKGDGNSAEYYCFARGMYFRAGTIRSLIPLSLLDQARGNFIFSRTVTNAGSVDLAFEGSDKVVFANGRYGLAEGWLPAGAEKMIRFAEPVYCAELQGVYELPNLLTLAQTEQIKAECKRLDIPGRWLTVDRTGNATGVHDALRESWDIEVRGVNWGEGATVQKILQEDKETPEDLYADLPTEMWFCLRRWLEFRFFLISPYVQTRRLFSELTKRQYTLGSKGPNGLARLKIETKREFKLANKGISPDYADAVVMFVHGCRLNTRERQPMPGLTRTPEKRKPIPIGPSPWDQKKYVNIAIN